MTSALRAPELSAILTMDSCWITAVPSALPSPRALDDRDDAPALRLRHRPGLHDAHRVARLGAELVVRRDLLGADHLLPVESVREPPDQRHRHGLLHLVARHDAGPELAAPPHGCFLSRRMV